MLPPAGKLARKLPAAIGKPKALDAIAHRVAPVRSGNRISVVAFAHGPAFT